MSDAPLSNDQMLKPCPFCTGMARFCDDIDHDHECHYIVCTGCGLSIEWNDVATLSNESLADLKKATIMKWNARV